MDDSTGIDIPRVKRAMEDLYVHGNPKGRMGLIEEAIQKIAEDGKAAMASEFIGYKNYAGFDDQRCDCSYGMGPRHGSIVFSIGRRHRSKGVTLGADHIYMLECVREFGVVEFKPTSLEGQYVRGPVKRNLCAVINRQTLLLEMLGPIDSALSAATVTQEAGGAS